MHIICFRIMESNVVLLFWVEKRGGTYHWDTLTIMNGTLIFGYMFPAHCFRYNFVFGSLFCGYIMSDL